MQDSETLVPESTEQLEEDSPELKKPKGVAYWFQRISIGIGCAILAISLIFGVSPLILTLILSCIVGYGAHEFYRAVRRQGADPNEFLGISACILFQMAALWHKHPLLGQYLPIIFTFITIAGLIIEIGKPTLHPIPNLGSMVLGAVYVGWLFSFIIRLRSIESVDLPINHPGSWLLFYTCGITWISDTGGLIAGNLMGRIKLAPSISPAKTWEGVFGGALAGTTLGIVIGHYLHFAPLLSVSLSLLISLCAPIGDLCESALKRNLGLKDFGTFFANHGGVLDRIDSLLFTAPVAYYFILVYLSPK